MADIAFSSVDDLLFGNGELYISIDGDDVEWRHLGNADEFVITTTLENVDKYSSVNQKRELMNSVTTQASITASATLTEYDYINLALALFGDVSVKRQEKLSYVDYVCPINKLPNIITVYNSAGERCFGISGVKIRPKENAYPCVYWSDANNFGELSNSLVYNDTFTAYNFGGTIKINMGLANIRNQFEIYVTIVEEPTDVGDLSGMHVKIFDGSDRSIKDEVFGSGDTFNVILNSGIEVIFSVDSTSTFSKMSQQIKSGIKAMAIPSITEFKENVDFVVDGQCKRAGMIKIPKTSRIRAGDDVYASVLVPEKSLKVVRGGANREISGKLLYVPDNSIGPNYVLEAWKVHIKPEGDLTGLISSGDFGSHKIDFVFLTDYENHPDSPYYSMTLVDYAKNSNYGANTYDNNY